MNDDNLKWLTQWYLAQCNDVWEHSYGVGIGTLDNPGWTLRVELTGTAMQNQPFEPLRHGKPTDDLAEWQRIGSWWTASVQGNVFEVACGPLDLPAAIGVFRRWVEKSA